MIDITLAKQVFNYIHKNNLSNTYEIIPFKEVCEIEEIQWNDLLNKFQTVDELISYLNKQYKQCATHSYRIFKKIPSNLKRLGHIIEIEDVESSFFCGREIELNKMNVIRHKKIKNNILLIGEPGVGKTSLVKAFAKKFHIKNLFVVECAKLISNTEFRGSFENKVIELMEFSRGMNLILFFDEIHVLMELGKTTGGISITDILKPYLLEETLCFIGATTLKEASILMKDEAFKRRFSPIVISEPSLKILMEIKTSFEHDILKEQLLSNEEALFVIKSLQEKVKEQYFPDKFIDFLDYMYAIKCTGGSVNRYDILLEEYICDQKNKFRN